MSGGQEKKFSTLGPKLRGSKAQQDYGDKQRQICIELIDYVCVCNVIVCLLCCFGHWLLSQCEIGPRSPYWPGNLVKASHWNQRSVLLSLCDTGKYWIIFCLM